MGEEALCLENFSALEEKLRAAVLARDWTGLEETLRALKRLGGEIAAQERQRAAVYEKIRAACGAGPEEGFDALLARIPLEDSGELSALYRRTRLAVEKVRGITGALSAYVNAAGSVLGRVIEEFFPAQRGSTYTRTGRFAGADGPLVINHSL
jgi:hypothetical protein